MRCCEIQCRYNVIQPGFQADTTILEECVEAVAVGVGWVVLSCSWGNLKKKNDDFSLEISTQVGNSGMEIPLNTLGPIGNTPSLPSLPQAAHPSQVIWSIVTIVVYIMPVHLNLSSSLYFPVCGNWSWGDRAPRWNLEAVRVPGRHGRLCHSLKESKWKNILASLLSLSFYEKVPFQINLKRKFYISFSQNLVLESQCRLFLQLAKFSQIQLFGFICFDGLCVKCVVSSIVVVPIILTLAGELQTKLNLCFHTQLSTLEEKRKLVGPSLTAACYIVRRLFIHRLPTILCPDNCHNLVVGQIGHSHQAEDTPIQIGARCFQTNVFAFHIIYEIWRGAGLLKRRCKHECFLGF